jgi:hypothetical protein
VEPVEIPSLGSDDPTAGSLLPQSEESDEVFDNRHGPEQRSTYTEDGIGRELVPCQAIPQAKIQRNWHADAVEDNECPEEKEGLLPGAKRVVQWRRPREVGVFEDDLCVRVQRRRSSHRRGSTGILGSR